MSFIYYVLSLLLLLGSLFAIDTPPKYEIEGKYSLPLEIDDDEFSKILGEKPSFVLLCNGLGFSEGPVYLSAGKGSEDGWLVFTDMVNDKINIIKWNGVQPFNAIRNLSWSQVATFRDPASRAIGQTADLDGNLLTAEMASRRVSITAKDGSVRTLVSNYKGVPLNSPNDLVVKSDGSVWFTDPNYGSLKYPQESSLPCNVYRYDPTSKNLSVVISDLMMPNGIAFSPDEKLLYVIDSGASQASYTYHKNWPHDIHVYEVSPDGKGIQNGKILTTVSPGFPDGMRLDTHGNLYVGALDGVHVYNPSGKLMGKILLPRQTSNLTFGGKDNNILFICSSDALWAMKINAHGAKPVPVAAGLN